MKRKLSEIKITEEFLNTKPSNIKVQECRKFWGKNHKQDRYLVVNEEGYLIDGYIQYLILKENKVDEAEIQISNVRKNKWKRMEKDTYRNQLTTYIYGKHPGDEKKKTYIWRVPNSDGWNEFKSNVNVDDMIFCYSKKRVAPVIVTEVVTTKNCPVIYPVNKVASREIVKED